MKYFFDLLDKKLLALLLLVSYSLSGQAQNWSKVELPPGLDQINYTNIHFINDNEGLIIGQNGTILRTSDGGFNYRS